MGENLESSEWENSLSINEYEIKTLFLDTPWRNCRISSRKRKCKNIPEWLEDENKQAGHLHRK